jgi:hypothetical protein
MEISQDTKNVIDAVKYISGDSLRKKSDLTVIAELCATYDSSDLLNNLIFAGKSVWNIQSKLKKVAAGDEGANLLQNELYKNIDKMTKILSEIIENADESYKKRFDEVYFADTKGSLKNLIDLSFDLSMFKELQNQLKYK